MRNHTDKNVCATVVLAIVPALAVQAQQTFCNPALSAPLETEARSAMSTRDYQMAARRFEEAFHACPEKRAILLDMAQAQISGRNFDEAIHTAEQYLASDHDSVPGRVML